jgi:hypothetical protein
MSPRNWILLIAVIIALIAGVMFFSSSDEPEPPEQTRVPAPAPQPQSSPEPEPEPEPEPQPAVPEPEPVPLPALDESDEFVRERVDTIAGDDALEPALRTDQLVRKFAVVLENLAEGGLARGPLSHLAPKADFPVTRDGERMLMDPAGFDRYEPVVDMVAAVRPEQAVMLLETMDPLLQDAYRELGVQDVDVESRLAAAIDVLLATPIPEGPVELKQPAVMYEYADPELEALLPAQKQLIRMGPENARQILDKLRRIRPLLGE